jgi:hypothetical protein
MPGSRRFPLPWSIDEATESFIVRDAKGKPRSFGDSLLTARRPAAPRASPPLAVERRAGESRLPNDGITRELPMCFPS